MLNRTARTEPIDVYGFEAGAIGELAKEYDIEVADVVEIMFDAFYTDLRKILKEEYPKDYAND